MAQLLLFQADNPNREPQEYVVLLEGDDPGEVSEWQDSGYSLTEVIEIPNDVSKWPTDRSLTAES